MISATMDVEIGTTVHWLTSWKCFAACYHMSRSRLLQALVQKPRLLQALVPKLSLLQALVPKPRLQVWCHQRMLPMAATLRPHQPPISLALPCSTQSEGALLPQIQPLSSTVVTAAAGAGNNAAGGAHARIPATAMGSLGAPAMLHKRSR